MNWYSDILIHKPWHKHSSAVADSDLVWDLKTAPNTVNKQSSVEGVNDIILFDSMIGKKGQ